MNSTRTFTTSRTAAAGAVLAAGLAVALVAGGVFDRDAGAAGPPASEAPTAPTEPEGAADDQETGVVVAAYVAPDELVFDSAGGGRRSVPVAGDVAVSIDGRLVDYAAFTLSFDETAGDGSAGGVATYTLTFDGDTVVAIAR